MNELHLLLLITAVRRASAFPLFALIYHYDDLTSLSEDERYTRNACLTQLSTISTILS
jgi:hypothetical protein